MKHEFCRSRRVLSTEAERNEVMIAAVLVSSVNSYEFLKDEISPCLNEISFRKTKFRPAGTKCRCEISSRPMKFRFRFITLLANNRCHRNVVAFSSETKVCNLFSEIRGFRQISFSLLLHSTVYIE